MVFSSSPLSSFDSDDGFYRSPKPTSRRKQTLSRKARDPEPLVPLALSQASQASDGPTPTQEARRLANDDEIDPQKHAITRDNEYLHRAQAKYDAQDSDYSASQEGNDAFADSEDGDADHDENLDDEIADLAMWDTELGDTLTTRASSMARSAADSATDESSDEGRTAARGDAMDDFPRDLSGQDVVNFGCRWFIGRQSGALNPHHLATKLRHEYNLQVRAFNKLLRFVQDHRKCWDVYLLDDPDVVLGDVRTEWHLLDEPK